MKRFAFYYKGLWKSPAYLIMVVVSGGVTLWLIEPMPELSSLHPLVFLIFAAIHVHMFSASKVLSLNDFYMRLAAAREANALMTFSAVSLLWLPILGKGLGVSWFTLEFLLAIFLLSLLRERSSLSFLFLPLTFVSFFVPCEVYQSSGIVLFLGPFLIAFAIVVTQRVKEWSFLGFRFQPRYWLMAGGGILVFRWIFSTLGTQMRATLSDGLIVYHNPDLEHPLVFTLFLMFFNLWMFLPFLNLLGFRNAEESLASVRLIRRTPCLRRIKAVVSGGLLQLLTIPVLLGAKFIQATPQIVINLLIFGVFTNTLWITHEDANRTGYAAGLYFLLAHILLNVNWLLLFFLTFVLILLLYDIDRRRLC